MDKSFMFECYTSRKVNAVKWELHSFQANNLSTIPISKMMTRTNDCDWSLIVSDLGNETDECKISQGQNAIKKIWKPTMYYVVWLL